MLYLFTENELQNMPEHELRAIIEAAHCLTEAHKSFMHKSSQWHQGSLTVDSQLVSSWWSLSCVSLDREIAIKRGLKALALIARETQLDIESGISHLWYSIAEIAELHDTDNLTSHDYWRMCDYVNDLIYEKSDEPRKDHLLFDKEFFRQKTNASRTRVCLKWARANWMFGRPDFTKKVK